MTSNILALTWSQAIEAMNDGPADGVQYSHRVRFNSNNYLQHEARH